jgi:hypothetical protein
MRATPNTRYAKGLLWLLAGLWAVLLLGAFVARQADALLVEQAPVAGNTFTTAASFATNYYLHNNPSPPTGNTASQTNLPLNETAPTATTLYNYDTNRDASAGLLIAKGGSGASEADTTKYQSWRTAALGSSLTINGTVDVILWSAIKDFGLNKQGSVRVFLRDYNGSSYTEICNGTLTQSNWQGGSSTWVSKTISFTCSSYTIPAGNRLEVKLIVNASADDSMGFAYDTTSYDSRAVLP